MGGEKRAGEIVCVLEKEQLGLCFVLRYRRLSNKHFLQLTFVTLSLHVPQHRHYRSRQVQAQQRRLRLLKTPRQDLLQRPLHSGGEEDGRYFRVGEFSESVVCCSCSF